jgi:penicillin-binding protein 2
MQLADARKGAAKNFSRVSQVAVISMTFRLRLLVFFVCSLTLSSASFARSSSTTTTKSKSNGHVTENAHAQKRMARLRHKRAAKRHVTVRSSAARSTTARATGAKTSTHVATLKTVSLHRRRPRHRWVETFTGNSFSDDNTDGDIVEGEDPVVRQAAIDALGNMNGTVVAIDPTS